MAGKLDELMDAKLVDEKDATSAASRVAESAEAMVYWKAETKAGQMESSTVDSKANDWAAKKVEISAVEMVAMTDSAMVAQLVVKSGVSMVGW